MKREARSIAYLGRYTCVFISLKPRYHLGIPLITSPSLSSTKHIHKTTQFMLLPYWMYIRRTITSPLSRHPHRRTYMGFKSVDLSGTRHRDRRADDYRHIERLLSAGLQSAGSSQRLRRRHADKVVPVIDMGCFWMENKSVGMGSWVTCLLGKWASEI
jgi:hypothetical protein